MSSQKLSKEARKFFQEAGKRGGKIGGSRAKETMTSEERSERAKRGWATRRKSKENT